MTTETETTTPSAAQVPRCPMSESAAAEPIRRVATPTGDPAWQVCGYHLVKDLFTDARLGRAHPTPATAPRSSYSVFFGSPLGNFETEPEDNARMRQLLNPFFSPRRMRELRPRVEKFTSRLLDDMAAAGGPADLHAALAVPLPLLVITELIGVPYSDREMVREWTAALFDKYDAAKSAQAGAEWFAYSKSLVEQQRRTPGGTGVLPSLCEVEGLSDDVIATLTLSLLLAGHETSVVEIGLGALALLQNPEQWELLVSRPELVPDTVDELLRLHKSTGFARYARTDFEVEGVPIAKGELLLLDVDSANHDPTVFTDPRSLNITRGEAQHLGFGYGPRYCLGAPLARVELEVVFEQLIARFPNLHLAVDPAELNFRTDVATNGVTELPVAW
ncbi:cytochrome P450 [Nocardia sp. JMUB6875]|uniref:cytochrome P450 n=1 Tax=Nocardia sp. JMUB6875 TaxID=3158170 RepID=UPI0032E70829